VIRSDIEYSRKSIADWKVLQAQMAADRIFNYDGEHQWRTAMDGFASKNYFLCIKCGARREYANVGEAIDS